MRASNILKGLAAVTYGIRGALALEHGELTEFDGQQVRWKQIAEGVFTGVPADQWDAKVHKRSTVQLDFEEILANSTDLDVRDLEARATTLREFCQASLNCAKHAGRASLGFASSAWVAAAESARANTAPESSLMQFLNQPFFANLFGVGAQNAAWGSVSLGVQYSQNNKDKKTECAANDGQAVTEMDMLRAALDWAASKDPSANELSVTVTGPSGEFTVKLKASDPNATPNNPQLTC